MEYFKKFTVGSQYYFKNKFDDYEAGDLDRLQFVEFDDPEIYAKHFNFFKPELKCVYQIKRADKNFHKEKLLTKKWSFIASSFLVPEIAKYFDFTINDLKELEPTFIKYNKYDRYRYHYRVFNFYLENNGFFLTDEQLRTVYEEYRAGRPERYSK